MRPNIFVHFFANFRPAFVIFKLFFLVNLVSK